MRKISKGLLLAGAVGMALALPIAAQATITVGSGGQGTAGASAETQLSGFPGYTPISGVNDGFHNGTVALTPGVYLFQYWGSGNSLFDNLFTVNANPNYSVTFGVGSIHSDGPGGTGPGGYSAPFQLTVTANTELDFSFSTSGPPSCTVGPSGSIVNCDYLAATAGYAGGQLTDTVAYLGFSDQNEALDHDHQDLTIQISQVVPEPATFALLGSGLLGLGLIRRRRAA